MSTKGRKPDYQVSALNKGTENKGNVGAAWKNDNGTISIVLNKFVVLNQADDLLITLFPPEFTSQQLKKKYQEAKAAEQQNHDQASEDN